MLVDNLKNTLPIKNLLQFLILRKNDFYLYSVTREYWVQSPNKFKRTKLVTIDSQFITFYKYFIPFSQEVLITVEKDYQ